MKQNMEEFFENLKRLPAGYSTGYFNGRRYGVTILVSQVGATSSLYAKELGGNDIISFNLYKTNTAQPLLKPCEMSSQKVFDFVAGFTSIAAAEHY